MICVKECPVGINTVQDHLAYERRNEKSLCRYGSSPAQPNNLNSSNPELNQLNCPKLPILNT